MTQQIQTKSIQPVSFIAPIDNTSTPHKSTSIQTSSGRGAGMRRMRSETITIPWTTESSTTPITGSFGEVGRRAEDMWDSLMMAFGKGHYAEALASLENMQELSNTFLTRAEFVIEHMMKGQFSEAKAYFLALMKNPEAIKLCDSGFEHLKTTLNEAIELAHEMGWVERNTERYQNLLEKEHLLYRGFLTLSIGAREEAIQDLKSSIEPLFFSNESQADSWNRYRASEAIEASFFFKILEQKLEVQLLPTPQSGGESDAMSLFLSSRYEEALALIDNRRVQDSESDDPLFDQARWLEDRYQRSTDLAIKGASLALLGRYSEALDCFEQNSSDFGYEGEIMTTLTYFHQGNLKAARASCISTDDPGQFFIPIPIISSDKTDFVRHLIPLAIRGFETA
jgi:tetratricopeptide (TPR) repeat protein